MAEALALRERDVVVVTPWRQHAPPTGLARLPAEWTAVDRILLGSGSAIDHVVVGPNGVFAITIDPDPSPALAAPDGIYRDGARVTTPVKTALHQAHDLRHCLGLETIAYPILVAAVDSSRHHLDRLGVVPGDRIAEHIWSHPGFPLRRSQRAEILWALRRHGG